MAPESAGQVAYQVLSTIVPGWRYGFGDKKDSSHGPQGLARRFSMLQAVVQGKVKDEHAEPNSSPPWARTFGRRGARSSIAACYLGFGAGRPEQLAPAARGEGLRE